MKLISINACPIFQNAWIRLIMEGQRDKVQNLSDNSQISLFFLMLLFYLSSTLQMYKTKIVAAVQIFPGC